MNKKRILNGLFLLAVSTNSLAQHVLPQEHERSTPEPVVQTKPENAKSSEVIKQLLTKKIDELNL